MKTAIKPAILYLDDEPLNLSTFQKSYRRDYEIFTCTNRYEALRILEEENIHVFMTDQKMPEVLGTEFLVTVRKEFPLVVRLLITAYSELDTVIDAINKGEVYRFISKPYKNEELKEKIDEAFAIYESNANAITEVTDITKRFVNQHENTLKEISALLHESIAQQVSITKMYISSLENTDGLTNVKVSQVISKSNEILNGVINEIRKACSNISPRAIASFGLKSTLDELCQRFEKKYNVPIRITMENPLPRFAKEQELIFWRIFKDLMEHILSNSAIESIEIQVAYEGHKINASYVITSLDFQVNDVEIQDIRSKIELFGGAIVSSTLGPNVNSIVVEYVV